MVHKVQSTKYKVFIFRFGLLTFFSLFCDKNRLKEDNILKHGLLWNVLKRIKKQKPGIVDVFFQVTLHL